MNLSNENVAALAAEAKLSPDAVRRYPRGGKSVVRRIEQAAHKLSMNLARPTPNGSVATSSTPLEATLEDVIDRLHATAARHVRSARKALAEAQVLRADATDAEDSKTLASMQGRLEG